MLKKLKIENFTVKISGSSLTGTNLLKISLSRGDLNFTNSNPNNLNRSQNIH